MKRKNPETSIAAYKSLEPEELREIYKNIIKALGQLGEGTYEEIAAYLKESPARIWKRLSELHRMELIYRPGNKRLLKSGRNGFTWMLTNPIKTQKKFKQLSLL